LPRRTGAAASSVCGALLAVHRARVSCVCGATLS
jgi:hypothetical protein